MQDRSGAARKILFHHLPKTAGTALIAHAAKVFGAGMCPARYDHDLSDGMIRGDYLFYHGHFSQEAVARFRTLVPDAIIFTFLRHPFARVLSQFHNWTDRAKVDRELDLIGSGARHDAGHLASLRHKFETTIFAMSLEDFLRSDDPDIRPVAHNLQAQYLTAYEALAARRLQKAVPNAFFTYDFIGLQELYEPCLRIVESKCGIARDALGGTVRVNTRGSSESGTGAYTITVEQCRMLEQSNAYDLAVFLAVYGDLYRTYGDALPSPCFDMLEMAGITLV